MQRFSLLNICSSFQPHNCGSFSLFKSPFQEDGGLLYYAGVVIIRARHRRHDHPGPSEADGWTGRNFPKNFSDSVRYWKQEFDVIVGLA